MDPARISLEDDRRGLSGLAFRFGNRVTYLGVDDGASVWRVELFVAPSDELQLVETDERGAKTSRQPAPGEMFDALELLSRPGQQTHAVIAAFALTGVELRAGGAAALRELATLMREAAADDSYPMPLRLPGDDRPLHLSDQGRRVLRQLADTLEQDGRAMATLPAVKRLQVAPELVDALRKRVRRANLQAYRVGDQWFVVLENLPRTVGEEPEPVEPSSELELDEPVAAGSRLPDSSLNGSAQLRLETGEPSHSSAWAGSEAQPFRQPMATARPPRPETEPMEQPGASALGSAKSQSVAQPEVGAGEPTSVPGRDAAPRLAAAPRPEPDAEDRPEPEAGAPGATAEGVSPVYTAEREPAPAPAQRPEPAVARSRRRALYGALSASPAASGEPEPAVATGLVDDLRGEIDFLRRQMQEKDRQITAWITETRRKDITLTRLGSRLREPSTGARGAGGTSQGTSPATPEQAGVALLQPLEERLREVETRLVRLEGVAWAVEQTPEPWTETTPAPWYRRLLGLAK